MQKSNFEIAHENFPVPKSFFAKKFKTHQNNYETLIGKFDRNLPNQLQMKTFQTCDLKNVKELS